MTVLIVNTRDTDTAGCNRARRRFYSLVILIPRDLIIKSRRVMKVPTWERVEVSQKSHAWDQLTADCILIFMPPLSQGQTSRQFTSHHADVSCQLSDVRRRVRGARVSNVSGGRTEHV